MSAAGAAAVPQPGLKAWLKRFFSPKGGKRWPAHVFLNIVSAVVIAWVLIFSWLEANWHVGVDIQEIQCLPYDFFMVGQKVPAMVERGKIYQYTASGLEPVVKDGTPMVKIAAAVAGDEVVVTADGVSINGTFWGPLNPIVLEKTGKTPTGVQASYVVPKGKVLMLGTLPRSYDGRYWGLVDSKQITGRALAIW